MPQTKASLKTPTASKTTSKTNTPGNSQPHHKLRTLLASLLGVAAISLVLSSLVLVWLNRTLTDTSTYVKTVAPLATKPEIQTFIAQKASDALVKNAPTQEIAAALLPAGQVSDKTVDQLKAQVQPVVYNNILKVVQSPSFATLWENSNQIAHAALMKQLNNDSPTIELDLNPVVSGVINELKKTQLGQFSDQIDIKPENAKLSLKGSGIQNAQRYYNDFKNSVWAVVALTLACLAGAIAISVHHMKTLRRILVGAGVMSLLFAFSIWISSYVSLGNDADQVTKNALVAIVQTLLHNLFVASLVLGVVCIAGAFGTKLYSHLRK